MYLMRVLPVIVFSFWMLGLIQTPAYGYILPLTADTLTLQTGHLAETLQRDSRAIKIDQEPDAAYYLKIKAYVARGKYAEALAVSDSTLMMSETPLNYYYQGWVNELLGFPLKAEWAYSRSIRIDTAYVDGYLALARLYIGWNKLEKAILLCEKALWIDAGNKEALLERSRIFALIHDYYDAIDDASLAIGIDSLYTHAYYLRGIYYLDDFQTQQAYDDFSRVLRFTPDDLDVLFLRSQTLFLLGRMDSAMTDARAVLLGSKSSQNKSDYTQKVTEMIQRFYPDDKDPVISLVFPAVSDTLIEISMSVHEIEVSGVITDESSISKFLINGSPVEFTEIDGGWRFGVKMPVTGLSYIELEATDRYKNTSRKRFAVIKKMPTFAPQFSN